MSNFTFNNSKFNSSTSAMEIFRTLARSKKLIFLITLAFSLIAFIFSTQMKPSYISSAIIEIGHFDLMGGEKIPLDSNEELIRNLTVQFIHKKNLDDLYLEPIARGLINIEFSSHSADKSINTLNQIIEYIFESHQNIHNKKTDIQTKILSAEIANIEQQMKSLESINLDTISMLQKDFEVIDNEIDNNDRHDLYSTKTNIAIRLSELKQARNIANLETLKNKLKNKLDFSEYERVDTQIIGEVTSKFIQSGREIITLLGFIIGLFISIITVLTLDYLKTTKEETI